MRGAGGCCDGFGADQGGSGGPPKPLAGTAPCARPGAAARGHPQPWKRPCTHKTPAANFSSSQGGSRSSDCRLGPKRKRVGRAGRGESISRPQESRLGGPCPRLPAPQTSPCFRGRSPCLIPQPQMIPLSPPEHHAAQPCPAAARRIPQLLAFLPRSHPRHLQSIARSLKIRCPPQCLNIKPSSSRGCCEVGPTLPPQEGHRPARRCAQRGAQPPHAPRAPSPWPCPGPELSHGWLRAEASRRGLSPPSPCASPVSNAAPPWLRHLLI